MRQSAGKKSEFTGVFGSGLRLKVANRLIRRVRKISKSKGDALEAQLQECVQAQPISGLPEGCAVITGVYTLEQAEEWIAEHNSALRTTQDVHEVGRQLPPPKDDNTTRRLVPGEGAGEEVG